MDSVIRKSKSLKDLQEDEVALFAFAIHFPFVQYSSNPENANIFFHPV